MTQTLEENVERGIQRAIRREYVKKGRTFGEIGKMPQKLAGAWQHCEMPVNVECRCIGCCFFERRVERLGRERMFAENRYSPPHEVQNYRQSSRPQGGANKCYTVGQFID
jgi:hypothetical protein